MYDNIITCSDCGCIIEADAIRVNGEYFCPDCAKAHGFVQCDRCGEWYDLTFEDMIEYGGETICESCRDDLDLVQCDECGEWFRGGDLTLVNGGWRHPDLYLCENCLEQDLEQSKVFYCEDCEEYYNSRVFDSYTTNDGMLICECCRNDHWYTCEGCGELYREEDTRYCEEDDCYYCDDCYGEHASGIHDYSYRPRAVFHGTATQHPGFGDPLTIGFELEVDEGGSEKDCARDIMRHFDEDELYLKHDSSVTFEIVTHPHTLRSYLEDFDLDTLCRIPRDYDFESHSCGTCGLHMHVGRAQLGATDVDRNLVIYRVVLLMYRHWASLVKFSRRREDQLSHWAQAPRLTFSPDIVSYDDRALYDHVRDYYARVGRYQALNLCNRGTIEFRLWRGSLKPDTVRATLQLTSNIVRYAMDHTLEDVVNSSWSDITGLETIPALEQYLVERDLVAGAEARDIPYHNEVVNRTVAPGSPAITGGLYRVGDHVIFSGSNYLVQPAMVGQTGTIVYVREEMGGHYKYLVQLDPHTAPEFLARYCHDGDGRTPDRDGYWGYEEEISLTDPDVCTISGLRLGDRVRMVDGRENPFDRIGTIVYLNGEFDIGVRFDGFVGGHDLGENDGSHNGWWCYANQLRRVA